MADKDKVEDEELEEQEAELLANREALSLLQTPTGGTLDPTLPAVLQPNDQ